jgi:alcohol dehydrogenase (cytochrome c)
MKGDIMWKATLAISAVVVVFGLTSAARAQQTRAPASVTSQRLATADESPNGWLMYGRDYGAHRYSALSEIDRSNVKRLHLAWSRSLGQNDSLEATPIVNDDTIYVTTGRDAVFAFDAKTGDERWHYTYPFAAVALEEACCNEDNRGVTLYKDEVITATLDAHLIALDAATGKPRWNTTVADLADGYTITSPPLLVKHMLVTGVGGGEYGIRGFVAAFDADTGKPVWRRYTVPSPGAPGYKTWETPGSVERPGGPTWVQGTYDPALNMIYWGVGNPTPLYDPHANKGNLLYTDSLLALDADTGRIRWYYQYTPDDIWDYDGVNEAVIVDLPINGKTVKAVAEANRNGVLYLLDRTDGKPIWAEPFVDKINFAKIDRNTGKPTYNPQIRDAANAMQAYELCPAHIGGKNWSPAAYDPTKHVFFIPVTEGCDTILPEHQTFHRGRSFYGGKSEYSPDKPLHGSVDAVDLSTGKTIWKKHLLSPQFGGLLVTAGGLVFSGDPSGQLRALDERSGDVVWTYQTSSGLNAPPITYAIDGQQYIAILSGTGGTWPSRMAAMPWLKDVRNGARLYVFALGRQTARR